MSEKQSKSSRFVSLKVKWAIGTAIGSLIISMIVVISLFSAFTQNLLQQERSELNHNMSVVVRQLGNAGESSLTKGKVRSIFEHETNLSSTTEFYRQPLVQGLSNSRVTVTVMNSNGKKIFQTAKATLPLKTSKQAKTEMVKGGHHQIMVGREPILSHDGTIIGYVQVENDLKQYYQVFKRLILISVLALCLVVIASGLLGYFLSYYWLSPLNDIHDTLTVVRDDPTSDARVPKDVTELNDELGELSRMFNQMLDQTQRYIDQQTQFVSDVSHELRTPVAIIQGHMEMLQRWGKDDPQVLDESIAAALKETTRMNSLIKEMLDLTRAEQVDVKFHDAVTEVKDVVEQVFNNFKMLYPDYVFRFDDDLHEDVPVHIYRDHLEQILIILFDNAVKYSKDRKEVHLSLSRNLNSVEIGVQDFGEGIPQEDVLHVFDRFYRVDKARSRKKGGNGLGLAIAERLVEGYHGHIAVESTVGSGSLFRITLPIVKEKPIEKDK